MSSMPGLKLFFQKFDRKILQKFFASSAPSLASAINWEAHHPQLAESIYAELSNLRERDRDVFKKTYATLSDINVLSEKAKDGNYYRKRAWGNRDVQRKWLEYFKSEMPPIDSMVMWIYLEVPDLFKELLARKFSSTSNASGGSRYFMPGKYEGKPTEHTDKFKDDLKDYLKAEFGYPIRVHMERNDLAGCIRFVVTTDPFPKYEQQYPDEGGDDDLGVGLAKKADCFYVTYTEKTVRHPAQFSIRCDYTKRQRDQIADYFAQDVLGSHKGAKPEQTRDLSEFKKRPRNFDVCEAEPDYLNHRYAGVKMEIDSGGDNPEIYMRMFNGDLYDEIERRGELKDVPDSAKRVVELYISMTLYKGERPPIQQTSFLSESGIEESRKTQDYMVTVCARGPWKARPAPSEVDERKIDRILRAMEIVDVTGEKAIKKKTRK